MNRIAIPVGLALAAAGCAPSDPPTLDAPSVELSATVLDFGPAAVGDEVVASVRITNAGQVPMGLGPTSLEELSTSEGAFLYRYGCGVLEGEDTAPFDPDDYYGDPDGQGIFTCVLQPGGSLDVEVAYVPETATEHRATLVFETLGEPEEDRRGRPVTEVAFGDPERRWFTVDLVGESFVAESRLAAFPRFVDLGRAYPEQEVSGTARVVNDGDEPFVFLSAELDATCGEGWELEIDGSSPNAEVGPDENFLVRATHTAVSLEPLSCPVIVRTSDRDAPNTQIVFEVNQGRVPGNDVPTVTVSQPPKGTQLGFEGDLTLEIAVADDRDPERLLSCSLQSEIGGPFADGKIAIGPCDPAPGTEAGPYEIVVPYDFLATGSVDVISVLVTDVDGGVGRGIAAIRTGLSAPAVDADGDGFDPEATETYARDCDDSSAAVHPFAIELANGVDDDCDGIVDDQLDTYDDDGDGQSEADGDCDDRDPQVYLGSFELANYRDDDCDGEVDEGTERSDDDGDGYSEFDGDCDDEDPDISPRAVESCGDNLDNDCNNRIDADDDCAPVVDACEMLGPWQSDVSDVELGGTITFVAPVVAAPGVEVSHSWEVDVVNGEGSVGELEADGDTLVWTAPTDFPAGLAGQAAAYSVIYQGSCDGKSVSHIGRVLAWRPGTLPTRIADFSGGVGGCDSSGLLPMLPLVGLAFGLFLARRRRDEAID